MESDMSSVTSSDSPEGAAATATEALQRSARIQFKSRIFLGRYVDRRLVSEVVGYRDLVLLSPAEEELQRELLELRRRLTAVLKPAHWVGVTDTRLLASYKPGVCVWTEIDDQPFGAFWFQIRAVEFRADEVVLRVRCLRHISPRFLDLEPMLVTDSVPPTGVVADYKIESLLKNFKNMIARMRTALNVSNLKEFLFFAFALIIATITSLVAFVSYLGTFTLSLMRESSNLIRNSTPLFLGVLDFMSKIIGGFYLLLAMIFRQTSPVQSHGRQLAHLKSQSNYRGRDSYYDDYDDHPRDFD